MSKVLVIDDERGMRKTMALFLSSAGHRVETATNGEEALALLENEDFEVVLSDIIMPKMDGVTLMKTLRDRGDEDLQVIMITGEPTLETTAAAFKAGAFDYLVKPIKKEELCRTVERAVEVYHLKRERRALTRENRRYRETLETRVEERTKALRKSERRYRALFDSSLDGVFLHDLEGNFLDANPAALAMVGYSAEEIEDLTFSALISDDQLPLAVEALQETIELGFQSQPRTFRLKKKDGGTIWVETSGSMIYHDEEPMAIQSIARDITARKKIENELKESEARYRRLANNIKDVVWVASLDLRFTYISPSVEAVFGYSPDEVIGESIFTALFPEAEFEVRSMLERSLPGGDIPANEPLVLAQQRKDGATIWTEVSTSFLRDASGDLQGIMGSTRDITARKRAEEELERKEERLALALDATSDGLWDWDLRTDAVYYSPRYFTMLGYEPDAFSFRFETWERLIHPDDRDDAWEAHIEQLGSGSQGFEVEYRFRRSDDSYAWMLCRGKVVERDEEGQPVRMIGTHQDITARKLIKKQLRKREEKYRQLYRSSPNAILLLNPEGMIVDCNDSTTAILGYEPSELIGCHFSKLVGDHPSTADEYRVAFEEMVHLEDPTFQIEARHKNGSGVILAVYPSVIPSEDGDEEALQVLLIDITEQKQFEDALQQRGYELETLLDSIEEMVIVLDGDRRITYIHYPSDGVLDRIAPVRAELCGRDADDAVAPTAFIGAPLDFLFPPSLTTKMDASIDAIEDGAGTHQFEYHETVDDELRWFSIKVAPKAAVEGDKLHMSLVIRDISMIKRSQLTEYETEQRYHALVEHASDTILLFDTDLVITYANPAAEEMLGYGPDELIGRTVGALLTVEYRAIAPTFLQAQRKDEGQQSSIELPLLTTDGATLWTSHQLSIMTEGDAFVGYLDIIRDISEEHAIARARQKRHHELSTLYRLSRILTETVELSTLARMTLQEIKRLFSFEGAGLVLFDEEGVPTARYFCEEDCRELFGKMKSLPLWDRLETALTRHEGDAAEGGAGGAGGAGGGGAGTGPTSVTTVALTEEERRLFDEHGRNVRQLHLVPASLKDRLIGQFFLLSPSQRTMDEATRHLMTTIAQQVAQALENLTLFESVMREYEHWRATFDSISDPISIHDRDMALKIANRAFYDTFAPPIEEDAMRAEVDTEMDTDLRGRPCYELIHHSDGPTHQCPVAQCLARREPATTTYYEPRLGTYFKELVSPIIDTDGEIEGFVHLLHDITSLVRAKEAVEASEARYKLLTENARELIFAFDTRGNITFVNRATIEASGYRERDLLVMKVFALFAPDAEERLRHHLEQVRRKEAEGDIVLPFVPKHRPQRMLEINFAPLADDDDDGIMGYQAIARDITQRVNEERDRELRLHFSDAIRDARTIQGLADEIVSTERTVYGLPIVALYIQEPPGGDRPRLELLARGGIEQLIQEPASKRAILALLATAADKAIDRERFIIIRNLEARLGPSLDPGEIARLDLGALYAIPLVSLGKAQGVVVIVESAVQPLSFQQINFLRELADELAVGLSRLRLHIAMRRHAEELEDEVKRRTQELIQSEKMAALGQLVAGVGHEINNPLAYLVSNNEMLEEYFDELHALVDQYHRYPDDAQERGFLAATEKVRKYEAEIGVEFIFDHTQKIIRTNNKGLHRISEMTRTLKRFARPDHETRQPADINQGLRDTLMIVHNRLKYKAAVDTDLVELPEVVCNIGQINQVFMNILVNAADAIDTEGEIVITTRRTTMEGSDGERAAVEIVIADTGSGIDPARLDRIFDPFYTSKPEGTGLGLSISYRIINDHGGTIAVDSSPGEGSTFTIMLPLEGQ